MGTPARAEDPSKGDPALMDVVDALAATGGVGRTRDLVRLGVSGAQITRALRRGLIVRVSRGAYTLPEHDGGALTAMLAGADLACISAAQQRGLWVLSRPALLHVGVDHGRGVEGELLRVHRTALPIPTLAVCLQCVRCLPELDALCIVESAVVQGVVLISDLRAEASRRNAKALRRILDLLDPHSGSILETVARYHLRQAGFQVASQVYIPGVGRLDLMVDGALGIEADGRQYHSDRREFEEDRRRWNLLTTRGVPILRVTRRILVDDPDQFLGLVRAALASGARHG